MLREGQTGQEESSSPVVTPMPTLTGEALRPRRAETDAKGTDPVPNSAAERERKLTQGSRSETGDMRLAYSRLAQSPYGGGRRDYNV